MRKIAIFLPIILLLMACKPSEESTTHKAILDNSLQTVKRSGVLRWGTDVIGGEPYVFEDRGNPGNYIGFEVDLAAGIAKQLGVEPRLVICPWDNLIPSLQAEKFDIALNGIEATEDRSRIVLFSEPYYVYAQQITVRKETQGINTLDDLKGKKVATLSGSAAEDLLRSNAGIEVKIDPEIIYSYRDLETGKVDAVVLDTLIADAFGAPNSNLKNVGEPFAKGSYIIAFRQNQIALRDAINEVLQNMKRNGELRAIYEKWMIMNPMQQEIGIR